MVSGEPGASDSPNPPGSSQAAPAPPPLQPRTRSRRVVRGERVGSRRVRVARARDQVLRYVGGRLRATETADRPPSATGRALRAARAWLFGRPISSEREAHERLSKVKALAVFASDALSSTAYATEQILIVLVAAGTSGLALSLPIATAITLLLLMVVASYRQTVRAYPGGGSSYIVSKENLGSAPGLLAAAALLTDYVLTVAVSISAGSLAVVSAFPELVPFRVAIAVGALVFIMVVNLRGVRESGTIFAIPTYFFIAGFAAMIAVGLLRLALGGVEGATLSASRPPRELGEATATLSLWLVLRAFSSGATALTGVEAIADGVTAFRPPEWKNASVTMLWMGGILATFFVGATFLAMRLGITPVENDSVISQTGRIVFGGDNAAYYFLQAGTALVLVLAANTAFNDFPRLSSILARDGYMPRQFAFIGDRLTFSFGIVALSLIAGGVLVAFRADEHRLIPLYAVGVFIAFTLSQAGMFVHWRRERSKGWQRPAAINGSGAVLTGVVAVVVASTKFVDGAWFVLLLIPALVGLLSRIHAHYDEVERLLAIPPEGYRPRARPERLSNQPMLVPVRDINQMTLRAVDYARQVSSGVTAVHVARLTRENVAAFEEQWARIFPDVPLVVIESPYRTFLGPLRAYIDALQLPPGAILTIVVPEFVPEHWWWRFLHNRTGDRIEEEFATRPNILVTRASISGASLRGRVARAVAG